MTRHFGRKTLTKTEHRVAARLVLTMREKAVDAEFLASLSRSTGLAIGELEQIAAELRAA